MNNPILVCPKCGYQNQPHRSTCKNCGEALTADAILRQEAPLAKRKKPLRLHEGRDWLVATIGLVCLVITPIVAKQMVKTFSDRSLTFLFFLAFLIGVLYFGLTYLLLPFFYSFIYLLGHGSVKGRICWSKWTVESNAKYEDGESVNSVMVEFVPEHARDPRPRRLECAAVDTWKSTDENKEIVIYYAFINPEIALLEGE